MTKLTMIRSGGYWKTDDASGPVDNGSALGAVSPTHDKSVRRGGREDWKLDHPQGVLFVCIPQLIVFIQNRGFFSKRGRNVINRSDLH